MTEKFISFDGTEIAYRSFGPASDTPPVVLQHGFIVDGNINWVLPGIVDALVATGRRAVTIDARGHGASGKPTDPAAYGEVNMARDVSSLADVLGVESFDFVGYSMGAVVAVLLALRDSRVRRLIVSGVGAGVVEVGGLDTRALPPAELAAALLDPTAAAPDSEAGRFRAYAELVGADLKAMALQATSAHAAPIALADIAVPTLVLCGREDPLAARPEVLAAAIPGAELTVLPGDHLGVVRHPSFAPTIISFLS